ncbi:MAG: hypothetical protein PHE17_05150 [Thiothrix sp.]|uniref:hypothetical protein n=1 Tax=Thiothrix sp. TaxID=1032 RepID=UPI00262AA699|nr:hypothetical protein [Thiothrix sp.]MDD5392388.1 hypothetical protein [Thiothrix sp.]
MNSLQHVLLSMLLALVVYLAVQNQQLRADIGAINTLQQGSAEVLAKTLAPLGEKIDAINTVTGKLGKDADAATNQKLAVLQNRLELYKTLGTVNQANQLRAAGKGAEAAEKLGSTKKAIWQAGEAFAAQKARLQGLMPAIDKLVAAWKGGDTNTAPDDVRKELEAVLGELGNEQK